MPTNKVLDLTEANCYPPRLAGPQDFFQEILQVKSRLVFYHWNCLSSCESQGMLIVAEGANWWGQRWGWLPGNEIAAMQFSNLCGIGCQGVTGLMQKDLTRPMMIYIWPCKWKRSTQKIRSAPLVCPRNRLNKGTMMAAPLALSLKPHNSVFPACPWHLQNCYPSARAQGKCLWKNGSAHRPFDGMSAFPAAFHLIQMVGIPTDVQSDVVRTPFSSTGAGIPCSSVCTSILQMF